MQDRESMARLILAKERAALDRWGQGDTGFYRETLATDVSYFDPFQQSRIDGIAALGALYESLRGKIRIDRSEIIDPRVQVIGDAAILTFQFVSEGSEGSRRWNCTEVYQRFGEDWRVVNSHFSFTASGGTFQ
jgi:hypothetical protein